MNTVVFEVCSLKDVLADSARAMQAGRAERGARTGFATPELLRVFCGLGSISIREAARRVGRDVKAVHRDITALLKAGLLDRTPDRRMVFPFDAVKVEFLLHAA